MENKNTCPDFVPLPPDFDSCKPVGYRNRLNEIVFKGRGAYVNGKHIGDVIYSDDKVIHIAPIDPKSEIITIRTNQ